jgi:hypothetical protein
VSATREVDATIAADAITIAVDLAERINNMVAMRSNS